MLSLYSQQAVIVANQSDVQSQESGTSRVASCCLTDKANSEVSRDGVGMMR